MQVQQSQLTTAHPSQPEPTYPEINTSTLGQPEALQASGLNVLTSENHDAWVLPEVILGCAVFGLGIYNDEQSILSDLPVRLVRLALRYGVNAFDTAPHYHPSEIILARALEALQDDHPRESYKIITKAGKFGPKRADHDYSNEGIQAGVERSLKRFRQAHSVGVEAYLDVVYLHDVEFIASHPDPAGFPLRALTRENCADYHLESLHDASRKPESLGKGDDEILAALEILRTYQRQGKIRKVGIAGYSLPLLLRLSLLIKESTGQPLDIIQSYGHHNLLNSTLPAFLPFFTETAGVKHVANASPFNMGMLTSRGPPDWHPASKEVKVAAREIVEDLAKGEEGVSIEALASRFGMRELRSGDQSVPVVIGVKNLDELHQAMQTYDVVRTGKGDDQRELETKVREMFVDKGVADWSWQSPPLDA